MYKIYEFDQVTFPDAYTMKVYIVVDDDRKDRNGVLSPMLDTLTQTQDDRTWKCTNVWPKTGNIQLNTYRLFN